jgi:hypothetical protein
VMNVLSCVWYVSIDRVLIGNWIYWTLTDPWLQVTITLLLNHTLSISVQHVLSLHSLLCLHWLSGNGFQHRRSLNFHVHILTGRQLFHN